MRPFSQSAFLYIFWTASASGRVKYSGVKILHCTSSDVLALPKKLTKTHYKKGLYSNFLRHHFVQIKAENSENYIKLYIYIV